MPWLAKVRDSWPLEALRDNSFVIAFGDYLKASEAGVPEIPDAPVPSQKSA